MASKPKQPGKVIVKPPILKLNRKQLGHIFRYLDVEDLSRLRAICRRISNAVEYHVQDLQVFVDWTEEDEYREPVFQMSQPNAEFRPITLRTCSPADFFYPRFPFKSLKQLYLCYDDEQGEKLNLTELMQLRFLKVRGALTLSSNRLPNVTHIDIDDPDVCEKQVFPNLKSYNLDFDVGWFSNQKNTTEEVAVKYAFDKSMDILLDKSRLKEVRFTILIAQMELILFEQFIDSFTAFMQNYEKEIDLPDSNVFVKLRYNSDYTFEKDHKRWYKAWSFLGREDAVPNPTRRSDKIPINPDEYDTKEPVEIVKQFSNLEFEWEGYYPKN